MDKVIKQDEKEVENPNEPLAKEGDELAAVDGTTGDIGQTDNDLTSQNVQQNENIQDESPTTVADNKNITNGNDIEETNDNIQPKTTGTNQTIRTDEGDQNVADDNKNVNSRF